MADVRRHDAVHVVRRPGDRRAGAARRIAAQPLARVAGRGWVAPRAERAAGQALTLPGRARESGRRGVVRRVLRDRSGRDRVLLVRAERVACRHDELDPLTDDRRGEMVRLAGSEEGAARAAYPAPAVGVGHGWGEAVPGSRMALE